MKRQRKTTMGAIPATQRKLRHAQIAFQSLQAGAQAIPLDREECVRQLSDFLSKAYSVVDVLKTETGQVYRGWVNAWWGNCRADEQTLHDFMRKQRRAELHRLGAIVNLAQQEIPYEDYSLRIEARRPRRPPAADAMHMPFGPFGLGRPTTVQIDILMLGGEEVTAKCERYLGLLEQMVEDFGREHP
jgi:hypothetical protein